jgi:hypothetical protein
MNIKENIYVNVRENYGLEPFKESLLTDCIIQAAVLECARLVDSFPGIPNDKIAQYLRNILK